MVAEPGHGPDVSLRVSVTHRCNLRCRYCVPAAPVLHLPRDELLTYEEIATVVRAARQVAGALHVHITGGEPLVRRDIPRLVEMIAAEAPADLAMTTNGQLLAAWARELAAAGLGRVNISLDTLDERRYRYLTGGGELAAAVAGIRAAADAGLRPVRINTVLLAGLNDDELADIVRAAMGWGCQVRFIELMPLGPAGGNAARKWFLPASAALEILRRDFDLEPLPATGHSPARYLRAVCKSTGDEATVGFITPVTEPFCDGCRRLRLTCDGKLLACLRRADGPSVRDALRGPNAVAAVARMVAEALRDKAAPSSWPRRPMVSIGG